MHLRIFKNLAASSYTALVAVFLFATGGLSTAQAAIVSQNPLQIGGDVPGNVALALSVEFPTAISVGHQGNFEAGKAYVGYFDHRKCYRYVQGSSTDDATGDASSTNVSYFNPVSAATADYKCTALTDTWSGSFLNWLTMQAVDPFRSALTGGYRRVDTATTTILERAWSSTNNESSLMGSDTNFPPIPTNSGSQRSKRQSPTSQEIADHTALPNTFTSLKVSVRTRGNQILFSFGGSGSPGLDTNTPSNANAPTDAIATHYSQASTPATNTVYRFYARVKVCVSTVTPIETNCKQYSQGWKPEGLLQDYSRRLRFSAVSYLNDPTDNARDGGVLRARQKFVGPQIVTPGAPDSTNAAAEWDATTGVFIANPDSADATVTANAYGVTIANSGVINYVNKFGQAEHTYKRRDPVSELYYVALRYLKNQGNVSEWMPSTSATDKVRLIDGFPMISSWNDPIQYACQKNYILGIGDTNNSWDQNLPGPTNDSNSGHSPAGGKPAAVTADTTVNTQTMRDKVRSLNGNQYHDPGDGASDLMAGLAYHAATQDIRPDIANLSDQPRGQNVSTYWLDVLEFGEYDANNLYYLATKYGGLNIPATATFDPVTATAASIPNSWWRTNTDTVGGQARPDNYYTVDDPQGMVTGLRKAFVSIARQRTASSTTLASNSTRLDNNTVAYQAQFRSGTWSGELSAYAVLANGSLAATPNWSASTAMLTGITGSPGPWAGRNIKTNNGGALVNFTWADLSSAQQTALVSQNVVNYLRGDRSLEESDGTGLRVRDNILGDIVNSTPLFVGAPNPTQYAAATFTGAGSYGTFAAGAAATRTQIVYVGANDGMLHAFNASSGREVFAFVPNAVINNGLSTLSSTLYEHKYFVDGETAAAEIYDTQSASWKTVIVGSLGRGGPGIFALDVTNPNSPSLLWEKTGSDISALGKDLGRPVIAQVANGDWRVILGNGMDSGAGAQLITIRLGSASNGTVTTFAADATATDGLSAVLVRDTNADGFADTAYAGDLKGALWKISNIGGTPTALKLFQAVDSGGTAQPITAAPMVARDPALGRVWVFFGTGLYLQESDIANKQVQTWYGVIDSGVAVTRADLVTRSIQVETTVAGVPARVITDGSVGDLTGKKGWLIDLVSPGTGGQKGERIVLQNRFVGSVLVGTSRIPELTDACSPGGAGWVMAINPFTGARLDNNFFDMNGDGLSSDSDKYCNAGVCVPVSGFKLDAGSGNAVAFGNSLNFNLDTAATTRRGIFGSTADSTRMSWRELLIPN